LVFDAPADSVYAVPTPKPMIVQTSTVNPGGNKTFNLYMAAGSEGANTLGILTVYSGFPLDIGQPYGEGLRAQNLAECGAGSVYSAASIATSSCQSLIAYECSRITSDVPAIESTSQASCVEANQPQNLYHMDWSVLAKRIECPAKLAAVTGCKLQNQ